MDKNGVNVPVWMRAPNGHMVLNAGQRRFNQSNLVSGEDGEDAPVHVRPTDVSGRSVDRQVNQGLVGVPVLLDPDGTPQGSAQARVFSD